ncbi:hypothetical protein Y032_0496g2488 [Ancylostoma ceylanicum]|uniref:Uncharacterized protein n=1 Tax=Ancylostoma ceylanicum TaxID=53326 RepID=A0A016WUT3_9BILA|nr:hypothetical protein Y032_0496g2488 [Ancylostoma ceylanicum]
MHKKSMEAAAHLEQVEKSSDISESDSEDGPSSRSSISANMRSHYHDDKVRTSPSAGLSAGPAAQSKPNTIPAHRPAQPPATADGPQHAQPRSVRPAEPHEALRAMILIH